MSQDRIEEVLKDINATGLLIKTGQTDGTQNINNVSGTVSLPTGASTSALQTSSNSLLTDIKANQTNATQKTKLVSTNGTDVATIEARRQTPTGNALNVQIGPGDPISNIPVVMDFEHHQIHEGETHLAQSVQVGLATSTVKFGITVPTNIQPHMVLLVSVYNGAVRIDMYETATFTGGALITAYNRNRNSAIVPATTITGGVTSTNGTLIDSFFAGAGAKMSGHARTDSEFILKSNTIYRIDLIGQAAGTDAIIDFNWYEDLGV